MSFGLEMGGRSFEGTDTRMSPDKHRMEVKMGEMKVMQMSFDGTKGYQGQMGQNKDMDEKDIKEAQDDKAVIPQLYYITNDFKTSYLGIGKAGDEDAYKIKITKPSGKVSTEYYSTKTNLLLREESTSTENGTETAVSTDYGDYKKVGNIMFPFSITQLQGEQEIPFKIKEIKINEGVTDADFK